MHMFHMLAEAPRGSERNMLAIAIVLLGTTPGHTHQTPEQIYDWLLETSKNP